MITKLIILVSLFDLDESATAVQIFANISSRHYLQHPPDQDAFDAALANLKDAGHLEKTGKETIEIEYSAYGLILELCTEAKTEDVTEAGLTRIKEVEAYATQVFVDEKTWEMELEKEKQEDKKRMERERLLEIEKARLYGYPYDILLQAREARRGQTKIYVVLLDDTVRNKRGVKIGTDPSLPAVYVGLTSLTPQRRFQNHKANNKAGRGYVRDYGICLLPDLYKAYNPMPRKVASAAEKALAEKLRLEGYTVLGGH